MLDRDAFSGVAGQAELLRRGEVSARELVELSLRRIERLDTELNAFSAICGAGGDITTHGAAAMRAGDRRCRGVRHADATLLALAAQLEAARPWIDLRRPLTESIAA